MLDALPDLIATLPAYLGGHMRLSVAALLAALAISLPLGILAARNPGVARPALGVASVMQTIPALALLALMVYSFARIGAAVAMRVEDFRPTGRRWAVRLREKGGLAHEVPAHHNLEAWLHDYIEAAGIVDDPGGWLFRSAEGRTGRLTERPRQARTALDMVRRRARDAGITVPGLCNHSLRATGITAYIAAGGALETAQAIAGHASPRTTQLYDRTGDEIALDEIERIIL